MLTGFSFIDSLILFVYFIFIVSLGFYYSGKKDKSYSDYFLAGRKSGWITVGLSIFAANISSEHFIGLAGSGASRGLAVGQFELMAIFILVILGWLLAPIYIKSGVVTMPEFLEKRFDRRNRRFFTTLSITIYLFTKITVSLFAGGILFYKIFGIGIYTSAILIVLVTGLYTVIGGATAVIKTNVFQAAMLIIGAVILTIFGLKEVGGFTGLQAKLPADFFNMFKPISDPDYPWTGIVFGAPILAFWYWCADQYIVQNVLTSKSINDARRGSLLAALLKIIPIFILVLPGLIAAALFPEINGDEAYPILLASNILPMGLKGVVLAGLLAAVMSSLASVFNVTATLFTNDIYKPKHPDASERELVLIGRLATTVTVVTAIICVPLVKLISSQVYLFLQGIQAYISPPIVAVFIFGLVMKKATAKGAYYTLIIGELIGISRLVIELLINGGIISNSILSYYIGINYLHFAIILFVISSTVLIAVSLLEKEQVKEIKLAYSFGDSLRDLKVDILNLKSVKGYKTNLFISFFIFLIIIGVWTVWN